MWFGTPNGLSALLAAAAGALTPRRDGLPSNDVNTLFEDRLGIVWVGTAKGIAVVQRRHRATVPEPAPRTLRGSILGIAEDGRGWLWITRDRSRPARQPRRPWLATSCSRATCATTASPTGCWRSEAVKRHRIVVADAQGRIWFALDARAVDGRSGARRWPRAAGADAVEEMSADGVPLDLRGPIRMSVQPPPDRARLRRPQPGGARARPVPLPARRLRSRLERAGRRAPGGLHEPGAGPVSLPRDRLEQRRPLERRRSGRCPSRSSRCSGRRRGSRLSAVACCGAGRLGAVSAAHAPGGAAAERPLRRTAGRAHAHRAGAARHAAAGLRQRVDAAARRRRRAAGGLAGQSRRSAACSI